MESRNRWMGYLASRTAFIAAAAILLSATSIDRHSHPKGQEPVAGNYTISSNVELVLLDVSVKHAGGGYVTGLPRGSFQVFEDGRLRPITQFSSVDSPVSVGLVLDNSGSMRQKRRDVIMSGLAFAADSNPQDEFFVVNFNDRVEYGLPRGTPFTDSLDLLHRALNFGQPVGRTALYDAIVSALAHLQSSKREMRTLIVVSDGGDNVSHTSLPETIQAIEASRASIYTVGLLDPEDNDLKPAVLRKFAAISGGEYFQPETPEQVLTVFRKISKDIRNRYVIGYAPEEVENHHNIRTVKVKAEQDGHRLIVRTRSTYAVNPSKEIVASRAGNDVSHP